MGANVKRCKKSIKTLVAATFSKAKTYVFGRLIIRDREVGGSNPLAPTILKQKATVTCGCHLRQPHFLCGANLWTKIFPFYDYEDPGPLFTRASIWCPIHFSLTQATVPCARSR